MLDARGVPLRRGAREVLCGVDLQVGRGELVALMGLSGGGKTTFLRAVAGLEAFDARHAVGGRRRPAGGRHAAAPPCSRPCAARSGMVFQFHYLFEHMTALHNVWLAPVHVTACRAPRPRRAPGRCSTSSASARAPAPCRASCRAARRSAWPSRGRWPSIPPLLLMDEPTASLDPARRDELGETLERLTAAGRTLLAATHDDDFVRDFADRVVVMAEGQVVEQGPPSSVLVIPQHPATRQLLSQKKRPSGGGGGPMSDRTRGPVERWKDNPYGAALGDCDTMRALADTPERLRALAERMTPAQFARAMRRASGRRSSCSCTWRRPSSRSACACGWR